MNPQPSMIPVQEPGAYRAVRLCADEAKAAAEEEGKDESRQVRPAIGASRFF